MRFLVKERRLVKGAHEGRSEIQFLTKKMDFKITNRK